MPQQWGVQRYFPRFHCKWAQNFISTAAAQCVTGVAERRSSLWREGLQQWIYRSKKAARTGGRPLKVVHIHDVHAKGPNDALCVAALRSAPSEIRGAWVSLPHIISIVDLHLHLLSCLRLSGAHQASLHAQLPCHTEDAWGISFLY